MRLLLALSLALSLGCAPHWAYGPTKIMRTHERAAEPSFTNTALPEQKVEYLGETLVLTVAEDGSVTRNGRLLARFSPEGLHDASGKLIYKVDRNYVYVPEQGYQGMHFEGETLVGKRLTVKFVTESGDPSDTARPAFRGEGSPIGTISHEAYWTVATLRVTPYSPDYARAYALLIAAFFIRGTSFVIPDETLEGPMLP